jgi:uncharacterized membrane-anchored protein
MPFQYSLPDTFQTGHLKPHEDGQVIIQEMLKQIEPQQKEAQVARRSVE